MGGGEDMGRPGLKGQASRFEAELSAWEPR